MKQLGHLFIMLLGSVFGMAQNDTIEVSKRFKAILVFPDKVAESIVGNDLNFNMVLPDSEGSQYRGRILKLYYNEMAKETNDITNYTVITDDGLSYDFVLKLVPLPSRHTWYIDRNMADHNIKPRQPIAEPLDYMPSGDSLKLVAAPSHYYSTGTTTAGPSEKTGDSTATVANSELYARDREEYYRLKCLYSQFNRSVIPRYFARHDGLILWLKGVYYNENEIYLQLKIENRENVDLDINFIKYGIGTTFKKSSSNQLTAYRPLYTFKQPKRVEGKEENHFVVVFNKFYLDENKALVVELDEELGNRNISLYIDHHIINNPIRF
ncbi:DUF4138 domain-containing protein [Arenibacter sp. 6A1]|uniref:DUF4138 domain-containing protein n=1 Tax=Arenibacter sp. 6A1 TaxID=2720391 RepID=UPI0014452206|nr:DUF4138 domain-containing protein [Arenibacter sp. 6A1]NKI28204.1 DUF4138 domain-containing protein [Arenibacter sp. 6A1]